MFKENDLVKILNKSDGSHSLEESPFKENDIVRIHKINYNNRHDLVIRYNHSRWYYFSNKDVRLLDHQERLNWKYRRGYEETS